jgi:hypothetical protein
MEFGIDTNPLLDSICASPACIPDEGTYTFTVYRDLTPPVQVAGSVTVYVYSPTIFTSSVIGGKLYYNQPNQFYLSGSEIGVRYFLGSTDIPAIDSLDGTGGQLNFASRKDWVLGYYYYIWARKHPQDEGCVRNMSISYQVLNPRIPSIEDNNLSQSISISNSPNPFSDGTKIDYTLPDDGQVSIKLYSITGQKISEILSEEEKAGDHILNFKSNNISEGIYYLILQSGIETAMAKLVIIK